MKIKNSILLLAIIALTVGCNNGSSPGKYVSNASLTYYSVSTVDHYEKGIHYKLFISANSSVFVCNATKDSIEIKTMQQLFKIK